MIGRIVRSTDFERVLSAPTRARSAHFAVHHVDGVPSLPGKAATHKLSTELSTDGDPVRSVSVDDQSVPDAGPVLWLGAVVPKRHAKRSVTRSLLKRQIRAAVTRHVGRTGLPAGLWVVRLKAPFAASQFRSAASSVLGEAARQELDSLLDDAARRSARA